MDNRSNNFLCPCCRSVLNIENNIIFSVKTQGNRKGLLLLSTKLGDYAVKNHETLMIEKGEKVNFFCPICKESLSANDVNDNLARVIMQDDDGNEFQILFSIVAGEFCTYMVADDNFKAFGDNSGIYFNEGS